MNIEKILLERAKNPIKKRDPKDLLKLYLQHFPKPKFSIIHIAGTNGKGSVSWKMHEGLVFHGKKTGLFTSPHISSFRERIIINHQIIDKRYAEELFIRVDAINPKSQPLSFFEHLVFMALLYFSEEKVDFAVLETGLGGRFDPTNLFDPILSIITQIGYDHMDILGSCIEKIAYEKAGIIKKEIPILLGPKAVRNPILREAARKKSPVIYAEAPGFSSYREENRLIAKKALQYLDMPADEAIKKNPPCRFEKIYPDVVLDVAHNQPGFEALFQELKREFPGRSFRFFIALSKNKEIPQKFIENAFVHFVTHNEGRLCSKEELKNLGVQSPYSIEDTFIEGLIKAAFLAKKKGDVLIIAGSFYIMDSVKKTLASTRF